MWRKRTRSIVVALCALIFTSGVWAKTIYVDDDAPAGGDGASWATACRFLQDGLAVAATGDEVRVAQGLYKPDRNATHPTGTRDTSAFHLLDGILLRGGYVGLGYLDPNSRGSRQFESILSGDLKGDDTVDMNPEDILDDPNRSENSGTVVSAYEIEGATLDGFTIVGGNARGGGGGLCCSYSILDVVNCRFVGNLSSEEGGAVFVRLGSVTLQNCQFFDNVARDEAGALYAISGSGVTIRDCLFSGNYSSIGNALYGRNSSFVLTKCLFCDGDDAIGIDSGLLTMVNCTVAGNTSTEGPIIDLGSASAAEMRNCIFWNTGREIGGQNTSRLEISYCDIRGGEQGVEIPGENLCWGRGNMDIDPHFVGPEISDFHLKANQRYVSGYGWVQDGVLSSCIDAGHPLDLVGAEPLPNGGQINMGAYGGTPEASPSFQDGVVCTALPPGDINGDGRVDIEDLTVVVAHWQQESPCLQMTKDRSSYVPLSTGDSWTYSDGQQEATFRVIGEEFIDGTTYYRLNDYFNLGFHFGHTPTVGQEVLCRFDSERQSLLMRLDAGEDVEVLHLAGTSMQRIEPRTAGSRRETLWYSVDEAWPRDVASEGFLAERVEIMTNDETWEIAYVAPHVGMLGYVCPEYTSDRMGQEYQKWHTFRLTDYHVVGLP